MLCEKCKIKKASVFYTDLDRTRHSLCNMCAAAVRGGVRDYIGIAEAGETKYSPTSYLYELARNDNLMYYCKEDIDAPLVCGECKISVGDILKRGYLNCPECYSAFSTCTQTNYYGEVEYQKMNARMPRRYTLKLLREQKVASLRNNLRAAIELENFELAAEIRDEIKKMDY